ncbi:MAG: hypothetical protein JWN70_5421, partial [Planctomycetaceae bacterium]|nr:hypothetical protein [Planctomycetaceae bacterium]
MHRLAAGTPGFPVGVLFQRQGHVRLACRIAHELKNERRMGGTAASIATQCQRSFVAMNGFLASRTRRLPIPGLDHGVGGTVASTGRGPQANGHRFPNRTMPRRSPGDRMGDLMHQRVENGLARAVQGVVFGDLNPLRPVLADPQSALRIRQAERPISQSVLQHFQTSDLG